MRNENAITNVVHVALKGILFKFKIIKKLYIHKMQENFSSYHVSNMRIEAEIVQSN